MAFCPYIQCKMDKDSTSLQRHNVQWIYDRTEVPQKVEKEEVFETIRRLIISMCKTESRSKSKSKRYLT